MRTTATRGPPVFLGHTRRPMHRSKGVCSIMLTTTMQTPRYQTARAPSHRIRHRPRSTSVSILTQPTAVPTAAAAPTSLTFLGSTTTEPSPPLDRHGTAISHASPTMGRALARPRTWFAMRSKFLTQRACARAETTGRYQFGSTPQRTNTA